MIEDNVIEQYRYLFNQISKMSEILFLHDSGERLLKDRERDSLIKIRAKEFNKLNRIIEKFPDVHEKYQFKYSSSTDTPNKKIKRDC